MKPLNCINPHYITTSKMPGYIINNIKRQGPLGSKIKNTCETAALQQT